VTKRPNILFIQPDQFRIQSLGCWSHPEFRDALKTVSDPVQTPALDRLAKESLVFNRATATASVCSPSRAMLMSGAYPSRNGVVGNCEIGTKDGMHDDLSCYTDVLAAAGYETASVGKAHWERTLPLFDKQGNYVGTETPPGGNYVNAFDTYIPPGKGRHGNKLWFQIIKDQHFDPLAFSSDPRLIGGKKDGEAYQTHGFSTVTEADVAIEYLQNKLGQRDTSKPFSILWNTIPPHSPYGSVSDCEQDLFDKYYKDMPVSTLLNRPNLEPEKAALVKKGNPGNLDMAARVYFSLVSSVDRQVGRVLQALEDSGEADNTIVIFTSDHGEMMGSHGLYAKSQIFNEAFLVPLMIRFPKKLRPRVEDLMIGKVDMMPTILGLLGLEHMIPNTVQGVDYSALLMAQKESVDAKPKYTYGIDRDGNTQLYDNVADPYQMKNLGLSAIDPADLKTLKTEVGTWLKVANDEWYVSRKHADLIIYPL
jgi:arylsulfatase A-like enzyme